MASKDLVKGYCKESKCEYDVYTKEKTDELLNTKADSTNVYTKTETYTKAEVDAKTRQNITTNGTPVKCGYKIDGKDVYVVRYSVSINQTNGVNVPLSDSLSNITLVKFEGMLKKDNHVQIPIPYVQATNKEGTGFPAGLIEYGNIGIGLGEWSTPHKIIIMCDSSANTLAGYVDMYFMYNN